MLLLFFCIFVIVVAISRYVSLGSVICGIAYPALVQTKIIFVSGGEMLPTPIMMLFALFVGLMLIITHRENIKRIMSRKENKISFSKKEKETKKYLEPEGTIKYNSKDK